MSFQLVQGNLDGACGFYAVLNAISEINGMSFDRCCEVFKSFTHWHPALVGEGYIKGILYKDLRDTIVPDMVSLLRPDEAVSFSFPFATTRFDTIGEFAMKLGVEINRGTGCAILGFGQPWMHWTAATSVTDHAIILKDSANHRWKRFEKLALARNRKSSDKAQLIHSRQTVIFKKAISNVS